MSDGVEQITIVGGGTAGWMTAMIVNSFLNAARDGPGVAVTMIESPKVPTIGVGDLFNYWNYIYTLWAKGYFAGKHFPLEGSISRRDWEDFGSNLARITHSLVESLPDHHALLASIRGDGAQPAEPFEAPPELRRRAQMRPTIPIP